MTETTRDSFLGGRLVIEQPRFGYRAATDPVLLAAAVPAKPGHCVLDVGCGVGTAALCLGMRVSGLALSGLERDPQTAKLAEINAKACRQNFCLYKGDLVSAPDSLRQLSFDHVITNPPFFEKGTGTKPAVEGREHAHVESLDLGLWVSLSLKRLKPKGSFTIIHKAERLGDVLYALAGCGDIRVLPISARKGRDAGRVLVRCVKDSRAPLRLLAPLVMHRGDAHEVDGDDYSQAASAVLRNGGALPME